MGAPRAAAWTGRPPDFRRVGSRRTGSAGGGDRAAAARVLAADLAQPADRLSGLCAADARDARGAPPRRRLPVGAQHGRRGGARGASRVAGRPRPLTSAAIPRQGHAMELNVRYVFPGPVGRVWDGLMDTTVIASCLPGCDAFEPIG